MHDATRPHRRKASGSPKGSHLYFSPGELRPSPENDQLYRPVNPNDVEIVGLAASIAENGILEPLVITKDLYLVSGHRRHCAALLAGLDRVPCRMLPLRRADDPEGFVRLLREHNRQREKSLDEKLREEVVTTNPHEAASALYNYRRAKAAVNVESLAIVGTKRRKKISAAKQPFLDAVITIINAMRKYWPLSDRQIHYGLLNKPPRRHSSKRTSVYRNDRASYQDLTDLLTRARLDGSIPFNAIADETRPVELWALHPNPRSFIRGELDDLLKGYWRDLLQSQPNHIELIAEKNTVAPILRPVCADYTLPMTTGRGYCSLPPRHAIAKRFEASGREKLVLLFVSDFDPEGNDIAHSFARSMRDDFGIDDVHPIKVALTAEQVEEHGLLPQMTAKGLGSRRKRFVDEHGESVYELEALPPDALQTILREAIEGVIDQDALTAEIDAERDDARWLDEQRQRILIAMRGAEL